MSDYAQKLKDPRWQRRRLEVFQAANFRCEDCRSGDKTIEVHHNAYLSKLEPWQYPATLLMCLCSSCHERRQMLEDGFRTALGKLTRQLPLDVLEREVWDLLKQVSDRESERLAEAFS